MAGHRHLDPRRLESVAPFTVERAYSDVMALGLAGDKWLSCTTTLSLTMELVLGARENVILANAAKSWSEEVDRDAWINVQAANLIRNVACHPACPPIAALCNHMVRCEPERRELAKRLEADWSLFGTREFADYALNKTNAVGRLVIRRSGI